MKNLIKVIFFLNFVCMMHMQARLSGSSTTNMVDPNGLATAYAAGAAGLNDCQTLQYYLQNMIGAVDIVPRTIIKGFLIYRNHVGDGGDFTSCDLGYLSTNQTILAVPADLYGASFINATMTNIRFTSAMLNAVNMTGAVLTNGNFDYVNAAAQTVTFTNADLTGASFDNAFLFTPHFNGAILTNAKFSNAKLPSANFQNATLIDTEFFLCDLQDADFTGANCTGTKFYSARGIVYFSGTNLKNADFAQTTFLYIYYDVNNPPIFDDTIMPDGKKCTGADCIKHFVAT